MKILVTGGAGFIGSNFIRYMINRHDDIEVTNLDKLTYCGNLENLRDIENRDNYAFIKGDICDQKTVEKAMKLVDFVFHFAAESHVDNSIREPFIFTKTNLFGTHVLLESARKNNVKRFIHISTDEVYGSIESGSFNEESPMRPNSPYSATKAGAELLARSYFITFKLPLIITRSSNNFGPYQYPEKLIPLFVTNLLDGRKVPLYGTGMNIRDWLFVEDNCEAIDFVSREGGSGQVYNVGGGNEMPNVEIAKTILKELGRDMSYIEYVPDRPGHDFRYSLDCSKIHALGWKPRNDFRVAIKKTIEWYKNNEKWWRKLKS